MKNLIETLNQKGFKTYVAKNKDEALEICKSYVKDGVSIGLGGSISVEEIGLLDYLISKENITLFNQYENGITMEENNRRRRAGLLADLYVTSTNAISEDGYLINIDGSGNRVAAMIYGPTKVLLVVGKNKIVKNKEDGLKRVLEVATVKNVDRMNQKAIKMGKEATYNSEKVTNKITYIKADEKDRISIVLVEEELGF